MNWFKKYLRSASFNVNFHEKTYRILALIFFPVWIIAVIPVSFFVIQGVESVPLYFKSIDLKNEYQELLIRNYEQERKNDIAGYRPISEPSGSNIDLIAWREVGINNPSPSDISMPNKAINLNKWIMADAIIAIALYVLLFLIPWLILRCVFWIKTAEQLPV